jgi:hypothetical protein
MPYFSVQSRSGAGPMRTYWVHADSRKMARTLVALNVPGAAGARDEALFDCLEDDTKTPPEGLIFSDTGGPITIVNPG